MYKLYNVRRWGSMAPHFLLEELDVPYTNVWMTAEQVREPAFKEISPLGFVPALGLSDGRVVFESAAIMDFLLSTWPDKGMSPPIGSSGYGVCLAWISFMASNLYPAISMAFHPDTYADNEAERARLIAKGAAESNRLFDVINARLATEGPFLAGDDYSAADLYLLMCAVWAQPSETALLERCKNIAWVLGEVRKRPRLRAALDAHGVTEPGAYTE
ncbi:MAG: glutathione S-transferase family protein [Hyphomicrobiales bacterium]